jgi:hypothetical protein
MHWPTLLHSWLPFQEYDVYVVGTQECQSEIVASLHSPQKSEWEAKICGTIGSRYCVVASETMGPFVLLHSLTFEIVESFIHVHFLNLCSQSIRSDSHSCLCI